MGESMEKTCTYDSELLISLLHGAALCVAYLR